MSPEGAENIKEQLLHNIESSFPKEKADILKRQIMSMNDEQLEKFVKRSSHEGECIFCAIASGNTESYKIDETESAVAILELNPASKGHVLIVPKSHVNLDNFPEDAQSFAKKVAEKIKEKLKPKDVEIAPLDYGEHGVINLIPVYNDEGINSGRYPAPKEELDEIMKMFKKEKEEPKPEKPKKVRKPRVKKEKTPWLPKRIP
jgi:histidine triad (HIT) family protein